MRDAAVRTLDMVVKGAAAGIQHRRRTLGEERGGEVRVAAEVLPCVAVAGSEIRRAACASARGSFTFHCTSRDVRICPCCSKGTYALAVCCVTAKAYAAVGLPPARAFIPDAPVADIHRLQPWFAAGMNGFGEKGAACAAHNKRGTRMRTSN